MLFVINNLFNANFKNISGNGSVNLGDAIFKGLTANDKDVGGQEIIGDINKSQYTNKNVVADPNVSDQSQQQL